MIEIQLKRLPLPCMLNQMYRALPIRLKSGRTITKSVLSAKARRCKEALCLAIILQLKGRPMIGRPCSLSISVTPPDKRPRDLDGYWKQLKDSLQAAGVVADDKFIVQESGEMMPTSCRPGWVDVTVQELP